MDQDNGPRENQTMEALAKAEAGFRTGNRNRDRRKFFSDYGWSGGFALDDRTRPEGIGVKLRLAGWRVTPMPDWTLHGWVLVRSTRFIAQSKEPASA